MCCKSAISPCSVCQGRRCAGYIWWSSRGEVTAQPKFLSSNHRYWKEQVPLICRMSEHRVSWKPALYSICRNFRPQTTLDQTVGHKSSWFTDLFAILRACVFPALRSPPWCPHWVQLSGVLLEAGLLVEDQTAIVAKNRIFPHLPLARNRRQILSPCPCCTWGYSLGLVGS